MEPGCNITLDDVITDTSPCAFPVTLFSKTGKMYRVSCGKCYRCLKKRKMAFVNRLCYEHEAAKRTYWITLTYSDENIPTLEVSDGKEFESPQIHTYKVLNHVDVQLFLKRLRKSLNAYNCKLRYFMVGEYGPTTLRPHYHMLLFLDKVVTINIISQMLHDEWESRYGFFMLDIATKERFNYCAKYCIRPNLDLDVYRIRPPYMRCSKGIGKQFITDEKTKYYKNLITSSETLPKASVLVRDGFRFSMPRYYLDKIFSVHEKRQIAFKKQITSTRMAEDKRLFIDKLYRDYDRFKKEGDWKRMETLGESIDVYHKSVGEIARNRERNHEKWFADQLKRAKI